MPAYAMVNTKFYGAKGDGVTDDTEALRAAIKATRWPAGPGGILFDPGTYLVTDTIQLNGLGMTTTPSFLFEGNGAILKTATATLPMIELTNSLSALTGITLRNLSFEINARNAIGIRLNNADRSEIIGCHFGSAFSTGVLIEGTSRYNRIISCEFSNMARGIFINGGAHYLRVMGCSFNEGLLGDGTTPALNWIEVGAQTTGLLISSCIFIGVNATLPVVRLSQSRNGMVVGCMFATCAQTCLQTGDNGVGDPNLISGCQFDGGQQHGIHIYGGSRNVITGCLFGTLSLLTVDTYDAVAIERRGGFAASGLGNSVVGCAGTDANTRFLVNELASAGGNVVIGNSAKTGAAFNPSGASSVFADNTTG